MALMLLVRKSYASTSYGTLIVYNDNLTKPIRYLISQKKVSNNISRPRSP